MYRIVLFGKQQELVCLKHLEQRLAQQEWLWRGRQSAQCGSESQTEVGAGNARKERKEFKKMPRSLDWSFQECANSPYWLSVLRSALGVEIQCWTKLSHSTYKNDFLRWDGRVGGKRTKGRMCWGLAGVAGCGRAGARVQSEPGRASRWALRTPREEGRTTVSLTLILIRNLLLFSESISHWTKSLGKHLRKLCSKERTGLRVSM